MASLILNGAIRRLPYGRPVRLALPEQTPCQHNPVSARFALLGSHLRTDPKVRGSMHLTPFA